VLYLIQFFSSRFPAVNVTEVIPSEVRVSVTPTVARFPFSGVLSTYKYESYTSDSCGTRLTEPAGGDAAYSCPDAGVYNYRTNFTMFGDPTSWYGSWNGFSLGISVRVYDVSTNDEFGVCYAAINVKAGPNHPATNWSFFVGGFASLTGLAAAGYMYRKRKVATIELNSQSEGSTTHFELVTDPMCRV